MSKSRKLVWITLLAASLAVRQRAFVDLAQRMVSLLGAAADQTGLSDVRITLRGETLAGRADTIARFALAELLNAHLDQPVNVINAALVAEHRHIATETVIAADTGSVAINTVPKANPPITKCQWGRICMTGWSNKK